jgi:type IV pilus assembly protein PilB
MTDIDLQTKLDNENAGVAQSSDVNDTGYGSHDHDLAPIRAIEDKKIPYDVLKYIPEESAMHYQIVPLSVVEGVLEVGMVDPENISAVDALSFIARKTGMPFKIFRISPEDFAKVETMYKGLGGDVDRALSDLSMEKKKEDYSVTGEAILNLDQAKDLPNKEGTGMELREDAPAIKLVSTILRYAIDGEASDIHVEPTNSGVRVRYRVDGILHTSVVLPLETHRALTARIKVLSSIRLDERRKPQDGRFSATIDGRSIDFRVSTFPTYNGEKIVIRILDREKGFIPLDKLGLTERNVTAIREAIKRPYGLILISGPTGSGKSTTLYSMLSEIDRETKNVLSLEDPVEYYIDGVNQSQVRPEIGYTFANGLRTTLRQDPNVIMVGEIRDGETAKLAIQAALTGHLVLSTIHTNSAIGTIPRLIDMGVEPYLIPPTLVLSMAQRLVRKLCPDSGQPTDVTTSMNKMMEDQFESLPKHFRPTVPKTVPEAKRTPTCPNGTRGRLAVFEVMEMTSNIEDAILKSPVESKIWDVARKQGVLTMKEDAMQKSFDGLIPFSEVNLLSGLLISEDDITPLPPETKDTGASLEESTGDTAQGESGAGDIPPGQPLVL